MVPVGSAGAPGGGSAQARWAGLGACAVLSPPRLRRGSGRPVSGAGGAAGRARARPGLGPLPHREPSASGPGGDNGRAEGRGGA